MELLQDGTLIAIALVAMAISVGLTEWMATRAGSARGGRGALAGVALSLVVIFLISEVAGYIGALYLDIPHITGYGRAFSYAVLGLILYVPIRIYQVMRLRTTGQERAS